MRPAADDVKRAVRHEQRAQKRSADQIVAERLEAHRILERGSLRGGSPSTMAGACAGAGLHVGHSRIQTSAAEDLASIS